MLLLNHCFPSPFEPYPPVSNVSPHWHTHIQWHQQYNATIIVPLICQIMSLSSTVSSSCWTHQQNSGIQFSGYHSVMTMLIAANDSLRFSTRQNRFGQKWDSFILLTHRQQQSGQLLLSVPKQRWQCRGQWPSFGWWPITISLECHQSKLKATDWLSKWASERESETMWPGPMATASVLQYRPFWSTDTITVHCALLGTRRSLAVT